MAAPAPARRGVAGRARRRRRRQPPGGAGDIVRASPSTHPPGSAVGAPWSDRSRAGRAGAGGLLSRVLPRVPCAALPPRPLSSALGGLGGTGPAECPAEHLLTPNFTPLNTHRFSFGVFSCLFGVFFMLVSCLFAAGQQGICSIDMNTSELTCICPLKHGMACLVFSGLENVNKKCL